MVANLQGRVRQVMERTAHIPASQRPRVAFLEWIDPCFSPGHWNPALIEMAGGIDVLGNTGQPSRTIAWQTVFDSRPDVLFISCCGFSTERAMQDVPILQQQPGWNDLPCVRGDRVYVTDGNAYFSRPGPRLVDSLEILAHVLHPHIHSLSSGLVAARRIPASTTSA